MSISLFGKPFQLLSDGKVMILLFEDNAIVIEDHFLKSMNLIYSNSELFSGRNSYRCAIPSNPELDLSIIATGEIRQYKGEDILKKFDIFRNFKIIDLLDAIKAKLKSREGKLNA